MGLEDWIYPSDPPRKAAPTLLSDADMGLAAPAVAPGLVDQVTGGFQRGVINLQNAGTATAAGANARALRDVRAGRDPRVPTDGGAFGQAKDYTPDMTTPEDRAAMGTALGDALAAQIGTMQGRQAEAAAIPRNPVVDAIGNAPDFATAGREFLKDPVGAVATVTAESVPQMLPGLLAGLVNPALGALVMGGSSAAAEYGGTLAEDGVSPDTITDVGKKAATRAGIVGTVDALSGGLAGAGLTPFIKGPVAREATNALIAQPVAQAAAGAGSEALAQVATGEWKPGQVFLEAIGEFGTAPVEAAAFGRERISETFRAWAASRQQNPDTATVQDVADAAAGGDTDAQAILRAAGMTDAQIQALSPGQAERFAERVQTRQAQDAAVPPGADPRQVREDAASVAAGDIDPAAQSIAGRDDTQPRILVRPDGGAYEDTPGAAEALARNRDRPTTQTAMVPVGRPVTDPEPNRMTPDQIAAAQRANDAGRGPGPEGDPLTAPEDRAPQTRDDVQAQREAGQAFTLADRQRERVAPGVRDTQTAATQPQGPAPQAVFLDEDFPVQVISTRLVPGPGGRMVQVATVQRVDPRTGQPEPDAVEYEVSMRDLRRAQYDAQARQSEDFRDRANPPKASPENPRMAGEAVTREPTQTFRTTDPDPTVPGAEGPTSGVGPTAPPEAGDPPGAGRPEGPVTRAARPEQPQGPFPGRQRPRTEDEAVRAFEEAERRRGSAQQEAPGPRTNYQDKKWSGTFDGKPEAGKDSRYATDDDGFVKSAKGGPYRFGDQKQAARWIISVGNKTSPDQIFEIAVHPTGKGFAVRETGRTESAQTQKASQAAPKQDTAPKGPPRALPPPVASNEPAPGDTQEPSPVTDDSQNVAPEPDPAPAEDPMGVPAEPAATASRDTAPNDPNFVKDTTPEEAARVYGQGEAEQGGKDPAEVYERAFLAGAKGEPYPGGGRDPTGTMRAYDAGQEWRADNRPPSNVTAPPVPPPPKRAATKPALTRDQSKAAKASQADTVAKLREAAKTDRAKWGAREALARHGWSKFLQGKALDNRMKEWAKDNPPPKGPDTVKVETVSASGAKGTYSLRNDADVLNGVADRMERKSTNRFYATPLDPAAIRDLLIRPGLEILARVRNKLANGSPAPGQRRNRTPGAAAGAIWDAFAASYDTQVRNAIERAGGSATATKIADMVFAQSGKGSTNKGATLIEAITRGTYSRLNELSRVLPDTLSAERKADIADQLRTGRVKPEDRETVDAVRRWLNQTLAYMRAAGVNIGEVRQNYLPREYDADRVIADRDTFVGNATRLYRRATLGMTLNDAEQAAEALFDQLVHGGTGTFFAPEGGQAGASMFQGRVFDQMADRPIAEGGLQEFMVSDLDYLLTRYAIRATKRAEIARRFGDRFSRWPEFVRQMRAERVGDLAPMLADYVQEAAGIKARSMNRQLQSAVSWVHTLGTIGLLEQSAITSLSEIAMPGVRSSSFVDSVVAVAQAPVDLVRSIARLAPRDRLAAAQELAEDLGIIVSAGGQSMQLARFFGASSTETGRTQARLLTGFFRATFNEQLTHYVRAQSVSQGAAFIRRAALAASGQSRLLGQRAGVLFLTELGVPDTEVSKFADYVNQFRDTLPQAEDLSGDMGEVYANALFRFTNQSSMLPDAATRPKWASAPFGRVIFALQSYGYAFAKNVLARQKRLLVEGAKAGADGDIASLVAMWGGFVPLLLIMPAFQFALGELRDEVDDEIGQATGQPPRRDMTTGAAIERAVSRAGLLGAADPYIQMAAGVRYGASPLQQAVGPVIGLVADPTFKLMSATMRNSPDTNTAERAFAETVYTSGVEPLLNALIIGHGPLYAQFIGLQASRYAKGAAVDEVAGPKKLTARDFKPSEGLIESIMRSGKEKPYRPTPEQRAAIRQSERDYRDWQRGR